MVNQYSRIAVATQILEEITTAEKGMIARKLMALKTLDPALMQPRTDLIPGAPVSPEQLHRVMETNVQEQSL